MKLFIAAAFIDTDREPPWFCTPPLELEIVICAPIGGTKDVLIDCAVDGGTSGPTLLNNWFGGSVLGFTGP